MLFTHSAHAAEAFADFLYWRATESVDWCYSNSLSTPSQVIDYQTVNFAYKPAFRVGIGSHGRFDNTFSYTHYYTSSNATAVGNLVTTFIGGKLALNGTFSRSGQISFKIDFNMFDWDLSQRLYVADTIQIRPIVGVRGGWINQRAITDFQGTVTYNENVKNNFKGLGPKCALESRWTLKQTKTYTTNILAVFTAAYLFGEWNISDVVTQSTGSVINTSIGNRDFGAFAAQGLIGIDFSYKRTDFKLGYEIADWFEQYQVLDDGTGARCVDLLLQGLTLGISYRF